jgi:hypothetical protein
LFSGLHLKLGKGGIKFCVVRSEGVLWQFIWKEQLICESDNDMQKMW